ncbi:MAG: prepilin-type N-terminal cleavage/methylation domain-containing protein [Luteolibacter sp.]
MKSKQTASARRAGFTLVELLVVIVIVAALSALGFVGAQRALDSASRTKSIGNLKQLVSATQIFSTDHNGALLDVTNTVSQGTKRNWSEHLLVTMSPELAENGAYKTTAGDSVARSYQIFADPKALKKAKGQLQTTGHNSWRTFAYNNRIGLFEIEGDPPAHKITGARYNHQVQMPNKLILLSQRVLDGNRYHPFLQPEDGVNDKLEFGLYGGSIMVGFFDGHVTLLPKKNYPSKVGVSINPETNSPYSTTDWNLFWFGNKG